MSKHFPPATDATPETLAQAFARHVVSGSGRGAQQGATGTSRLPESSSESSDTRPEVSQESLSELFRQLDSRSGVAGSPISPERQEELRRAVVEVEDAVREGRRLDLSRFQ